MFIITIIITLTSLKIFFSGEVSETVKQLIFFNSFPDVPKSHVLSHCLVCNGIPAMTGNSSTPRAEFFNHGTNGILDGSFFFFFSLKDVHHPRPEGQNHPQLTTTALETACSVFNEVLAVSKFFLMLSGSLLSYFCYLVLSFGDTQNKLSPCSTQCPFTYCM